MSYHHNLEEIWISIGTEISISFSYNQEIVSPCSISVLNLVHRLTSDNAAADLSEMTPHRFSVWLIISYHPFSALQRLWLACQDPMRSRLLSQPLCVIYKLVMCVKDRKKPEAKMEKFWLSPGHIQQKKDFNAVVGLITIHRHIFLIWIQNAIHSCNIC